MLCEVGRVTPNHILFINTDGREVHQGLNTAPRMGEKHQFTTAAQAADHLLNRRVVRNRDHGGVNATPTGEAGDLGVEGRELRIESQTRTPSFRESQPLWQQIRGNHPRTFQRQAAG